MTPSDIPACMRLKDAAGWNQTVTDLRNLLALAPDGCFGIDCDGELRATTTAVCFRQEPVAQGCRVVCGRPAAFNSTTERPQVPARSAWPCATDASETIDGA